MHLLINKKRIYLYLLIFFTLSTLVNINYSKNLQEFFNLKYIVIDGLEHEYQNKLKEDLNLFKNKNILFISAYELSDILEKYNEFESYKIQKIFPFKLKVEIKETKYIAKTIINGKEFLVGKNKKFIELKNFALDQHVPVIFGNFPIDSFMNLQENLKKNNFDLEIINNYFYFKSDRWDLEIEKNITIKLPKNNQFEALKTYQLLQKKNKIKEKSIIDFRLPKKIIISND